MERTWREPKKNLERTWREPGENLERTMIGCKSKILRDPLLIFCLCNLRITPKNRAVNSTLVYVNRRFSDFNKFCRSKLGMFTLVP